MEALRGIKIWMAVKGINARIIARKSGRSDPFVCLFFQKERTSGKFVDYLIREGCPAEYFKDGKVADGKVAA